MNTIIQYEESIRYCKTLVDSHYENFTVAAKILPAALLPHFYAIYAYCRYSDDLADEIPDQQKSLQALLDWEKQVILCYDGKAEHPILLALSHTIRAYDIPRHEFLDLLDAFKKDHVIHRYRTFEDLLDYCDHSANPVGHLVLYLFQYRDSFRQGLSDLTCTALQLANFWQDVSIDIQKGRVYIPQDDMKRFGVVDKDIETGNVTDGFRALMDFEIARTEGLFKKGLKLIHHVKPRYAALAIDLFSRGGMKILEKIRKENYDVFNNRPRLSRTDKRVLAFQSVLSGNWI